MANLILYTTLAIIRAIIAITITTILRTSTGIGAITVIGTTGTAMTTMIKPKRFFKLKTELSDDWGGACGKALRLMYRSCDAIEEDVGAKLG